MTGLVLGGVKHCGKTSIGRRLAALLGTPFIDTDEQLEKSFGERFGETLNCREMFRKYGEAFFREQEAAVIRELIEAQPSERRVIALGGGVPANLYLKRGDLRALGFCVYLEIAPEIAWARIREEHSLPPYLARSADPRAAFLEQFREREEFYRAFADLTVNLSETESAEAAAEFLLRRLRETPGVRII